MKTTLRYEAIDGRDAKQWKGVFRGFRLGNTFREGVRKSGVDEDGKDGEKKDGDRVRERPRDDDTSSESSSESDSDDSDSSDSHVKEDKKKHGDKTKDGDDHQLTEDSHVPDSDPYNPPEYFTNQDHSDQDYQILPVKTILIRLMQESLLTLSPKIIQKTPNAIYVLGTLRPSWTHLFQQEVKKGAWVTAKNFGTEILPSIAYALIMEWLHRDDKDHKSGSYWKEINWGENYENFAEK